jgi:hypothetical protein
MMPQSLESTVPVLHSESWYADVVNAAHATSLCQIVQLDVPQSKILS